MTINRLTTAMTLPRQPREAKLRWWRPPSVLTLLIAAAVCALNSAYIYWQAFAEDDLEWAVQQSVRLQESILFAVLAGFLFIAAMLLAVVKSLYGTAGGKEPYPDPFPQRSQSDGS